MNKLRLTQRLWVLPLGLFFFAVACQFPSESESVVKKMMPMILGETFDEPADSAMLVETLNAGQHMHAGTVSLKATDKGLVVIYETAVLWHLKKTHLWVGYDVTTMPRDERGAPDIEKFPFGSDDLKGKIKYAAVIPVDRLEMSCPGERKKLYIAAHAVVEKMGSMGESQIESGWAGEMHFADNKAWASYFGVDLSCTHVDKRDGFSIATVVSKRPNQL